MLVVFVFFFLIFPSVSSLPFNQDDLYPLLLFKNLLLQDTSNSLSSWVNSTHPCSNSSSWKGVTCNPATHRVTRLVLENLNLIGPIDSLSQLSELRLLSFKNNQLFSTSPINFSSCLNLKHLYLSYNNLSSPFPAGVSNLRRLRRLDLSHNEFHGKIPFNELSQLPYLLTLRLESNSFIGPVDSVELSSLTEFNVSSNSLSGEIPTWMSRFPESSFAGNEGLCGGPVKRECSSGDGTAKKKSVSVWVVVIIVIIDAGVIVGVLVGVTCLCLYKRSKKAGGDRPGVDVVVKKISRPSRPRPIRPKDESGDSQEIMMMFEGCKGISNVDDLLTSSAEFLGKGCVGTTYKVMMGGGKGVVVVKRVRERRKSREVDGWLRVIGGLRHPNVVSLRAYFNSKEELLLVYDFMPCGSLHSLIHGNRGPGRIPLDWTTRLKLASESAQGIAYLHGYNKAKLFHGNLTSSNILVDPSGNACISEIGLHHLLHSPNPNFSNKAYLAPEITFNSDSISTRKFTRKCDVYSFGVVLLEILTGKIPRGEGETSSVKWVQRLGREEWGWEVFDFELLRYREMEVEMVALMEVALLCLAPMPRDRPKMSMVHRMIEDIRIKGEGGCGGQVFNNVSSDSSPSLSENTYNFNFAS